MSKDEQKDWIRHFQIKCDLCDHRGYHLDDQGNYIRCKCTLNGIRLKNLETHVPREYWPYTIDDFSGNQYMMPDPRQVTEIQLRILWFCRNLANCVKDGVNLFIYGGANSGKTMLAFIALQEAIASGYTVDRMNFSAFIALSNRYNHPDFDLETMQDKFCDPDILMLDKISPEDKRQAAKGISFINSVFDRRMMEKKPTIITSRDSISSVRNSFGSNMEAMIRDVKKMKVKVDQCPRPVSMISNDKLSDYIWEDKFANGSPIPGKTIILNLGSRAEVEQQKEREQVEKTVQSVDSPPRNGNKIDDLFDD